MKLSSVLRHPSALSASVPSTNTTSPATSSTTTITTATSDAPADAPSRPSTRRRSSFFRSLRKSPSKQKLAAAPSERTSSSSQIGGDPANAEQQQQQKQQAKHRALPQLKVDPPTSTPLDAALSLSADAATASSPARSRPPLPRSPLIYSRSSSPTKSANGIPKADTKSAGGYFTQRVEPAEHHSRMTRKRIWVRRPGATPTQVHINEDDLVDDLKDLILRKYGNSLGRSYDSPDVTIRLVPRERSVPERALGPDEAMTKTLEACFPGGQAIEEALVIDVPVKRTPKPSPRIVGHATHYFEDHRPLENGTDYFPPMPAQSPNNSSTHSHSHSHSHNHDARLSHNPAAHPHSISIIETGQVPALPSPGARKTSHRPHMRRTHTSSPTILGAAGQQSTHNVRPGARVRRDSDHQRQGHAQNPPPIPTPPGSEVITTNTLVNKAATPPAERVSSPRPSKGKKSRRGVNGNTSLQNANGDPRSNPSWPGLPPGILDNSVPPINVLIVEDNIINLKLLEQLARKLKIRWSTAMNGRDAVEKWRTGGFHLVLMDIQLPIMNGLEATKEIRRLEKLNGIAVFARSGGDDSAAISEHASSDDGKDDTLKAADDTDKLDPSCMIKSPVIIVALTASSLQSDRHEALAAGCNDFLTKPVNTVWFERKVMEWGCMQALIDFEGWRKWKDLSKEQEREKAEREKTVSAEELERRRKKEAKRAAMLAKMGQA